MLSEPLTSVILRWGNGGPRVLGNGVGAMTVASGLPCFDVDQVLLVVIPSLAAVNAYMRLSWSADGTTYGADTVEEVAALVGGARRYTLTIKEWGPFAGSTARAIPRPAAAHFLEIGFYVDAAPAGADFIQVHLERQRMGQLQAQGG